MKILVLLTVLITVGCILAAGCVAQTKKDPGNGNVSIPPTNTFTPFVNTTTVPASNTTINATNVTSTSVLKGPLRVSTSGYPATLEVMIDNNNSGLVTREKPLDLMLEEGVHTVSVCVGDICEKENVTIVFAKKTFVDFGDRLRKVVEFPVPTGRILEYYKNGDGVTVAVEFINPSTKDLTMSAEIRVGYSFIDPRTGTRKGESSRSNLMDTVRAGTRYTYNVDLYFVDGQSYIFDIPTISEITYK
jgi:hypothetical protein